MIGLNQIVSLPMSARFAVVAEIFDNGPEKLAHVHYLAITTGELMKCPDPHCHGEHTCPIHGRNIQVERLSPIDSEDAEFYWKEGLISDGIYAAHLKSLMKRTTP